MGQDHRAALHINSVNAGWTDERVERAARLWVDGWSAAQIARDLRVTRNAVIGIVHRRGLSRSAPAKPMRAPPVKRAPNQNAGLAFRGARPRQDNLVAVNVERRAAAPGPGLYPLVSAALPASSPKPWTERGFNECTWPVGDGEGPDLLSCCKPVQARGWCAAHFALGTQKAVANPKPLGAPRHRRAA